MVKIIRYREEYFDQVEKIYRDNFNDLTEQSLAKELLSESNVYYVAVENENVCGFIGYSDFVSDLSILDVAVASEYKRQGIGTKLIKQVVDDAIIKKRYAVSLEVNETNQTALAFYKKNGFIVTNVRKKYYKENDALIMWLFL